MDFSQTNSIFEIENLRHEVITNKGGVHNDPIFKLIIIGDSGTFHQF
jgi:hypothetical protein